MATDQNVDMFHVESLFTIDPIRITVHINKKPFVVEVDSGAGMSIVPENLYLKELSDLKLLPRLVTLKSMMVELLSL